MRLALPITVLASIALASCASTPSPDSSRTEPVRELAALAAIDAPGGLDRPCERPVTIAERDLSAGDVERLWGHDRIALRSCADRHAANVRWRRRRDAGLAGVTER